MNHFSDIVETIRSSADRTITIQLPHGYINTQKAVVRPSMGLNNENMNPNTMKMQVPAAQSKPTAATPVKTAGITACIYHSDNNNIVTDTHEIALDESEKKIQHLEQEVKEAKKEVVEIKNERRGNEGQIMFLKYQLDKLKGKQQDKHEDIPTMYTTQKDSSESVQWLRHWNTFKPTLDLIKTPSAPSTQLACTVQDASTASVATTTAVSDTELQMKKELYTQERISFRLEMQLRTWVDSQINLQKELASQDSETYFELKENEEETKRGGKVEDQVEKASSIDDAREKLGTVSVVLSPPIVQRPLMCPEDHSFRMISTCVHTTPLTVLSTHDITNIPDDDTSPRNRVSQTVPDQLTPTVQQAVVLQESSQSFSSADTRKEQWESFLCSPSPIANSHTNNSLPNADRGKTPSESTSSTGSVSSQKKTGNTNDDKGAALSPQLYRAILSSHEKKPLHYSRLPVAKNESLLTSSVPVTITEPVVDHDRHRAGVRTSMPHRGGTYTYTRDSSGYSRNNSSNYTRYSRSVAGNDHPPSSLESKAQSKLSYSALSSVCSEQQHIKSRALKERMLKLKQESNKIRDDLVRFRSTMQEVREECTN